MPPKRSARVAAADAQAATPAAVGLFDNLTFCIAGKNDDTVVDAVEENGGQMSASVTKSVNYVIVPDLDAAPKGKLTTAAKYNLPLVTPSFVSDSVDKKAVQDPAQYAPAGSSSAPAAATPAVPVATPSPAPDAADSKKRKGAPAADASSSSSAAAPAPAAAASSKKAKIARPHVDELCRTPRDARVYMEGDVAFAVKANQTIIAQNSNKFYVAQVVECNFNSGAPSYLMHTRWGRVGETGACKTDSFPNAEAAKQAFFKKYKDKIACKWEDRHSYVPKSGSYVPLELDYEESDAPAAASSSADAKGKAKQEVEILPCTLPSEVQSLLSLISDRSLMTRTLQTFNINTDEMPLGKLSTNAVKNAYSALKRIEQKLKGGAGAPSESLADLTSMFYTLMPHDFGRRKPPVMSSLKDVEEKMDMLDSLLSIATGEKILKDAEEAEAAEEKKEDAKITRPHHFDELYQSLRCDLRPLDHASETFKFIEEYVRKTHGATHSQYTLEVLDVFEAQRDGESERYEPFSKNHNRRLLWHGSRTSNWVGILSQGLRIAPPEAPSTGYMFGKGVYFADMVSKSSNYCFTTRQDPIGCLLLSEVALGDFYERLQAEYIEKLPDGKMSTWGKGRNTPNEAHWKTLPCGTVVPCGEGVDSNIAGAYLQYNEFITYNVAQSRMRYLLKVKFNYKAGGWY